MNQTQAPPQPHRASFAELFTPKLVTVLREGYGLNKLHADAISGLTVAVVALPLSMAIAIASGVSPVRGLYTSVIGGFIVSALGGSRFQIGGPAGAFIVLVAACVARQGLDGLLLAMLISGALMIAMGYLQLGTYIKFMPYPVTVGFTTGIAVVIFSSQIKDLFGLSLSGPEPGALAAKLPVLWHALPTFNVAAAGLAFVSIVIIFAIRQFRPSWPGMLVAVVIAALATSLLHLNVETIGTRFGTLPNVLQTPHLPPLSYAKLVAVLPDAIAFTLLGAIESLLSAVVADGMSGRRHRSNCELVAQGFANIASSLFGGICVTGTVARTATNVRAGARSPVSGMLHSAFVLLFLLVGARLASYVPLAALAGVLAVVCWNMAERHAFAMLLRASPGDAAVLLATFGLTIFRSLTEGIIVGFALGALLFIHRMSQSISVEHHSPPLVPEDVADSSPGRTPFDPGRNVIIYRITGALFFGASSGVAALLERTESHGRALVLDFAAVPLIDSTGANMIAGIARRASARGVAFYVAAASEEIQRELETHGARAPLVVFAASVAEAASAFEEHRAATPMNAVPATG